MKPNLSTLSLIAALSLAGAAWAQDSTEQPAAETPAQPTAETPATPETAPAAEAPATEASAEPKEPQIGETYVKETHGDWDVMCVRAPLGQGDPCQIFQLLKDEQGGSVAEISITPVPGGSDAVAKMNIGAPIGTLLPPGVTVSIDGRAIGRIPFLFCSPRRCTAEVPMKAADVKAFKAGGKAQIEIVALAQPEPLPVKVEASLTGFTAGYDSLPKPE